MVSQLTHRARQTTGSGNDAKAIRTRWLGGGHAATPGAALLMALRGSVAAPRPQDVTPAAQASSGLPGVTIEPLGSGMPEATPGQALALLRVTLAPGATIPPHTQPGA